MQQHLWELHHRLSAAHWSCYRKNWNTSAACQEEVQKPDRVGSHQRCHGRMFMMLRPEQLTSLNTYLCALYDAELSCRLSMVAKVPDGGEPAPASGSLEPGSRKSGTLPGLAKTAGSIRSSHCTMTSSSVDFRNVPKVSSCFLSKQLSSNYSA